jgi:nucleotide-binding universal stress UspA family protein
VSTVHTEVLVGSDGSTTAQRAVRAAARLALVLGVPLTVVTAWTREIADGPSLREESRYPGGGASGAEAMWATQTVADAASAARSQGLDDVHTATPQGSPAEALLDLAASRPGSLVVVGGRGLDQRSERWVGNVPHQLTHHCPRDLLLVRSHEKHHDWGSVAIATDGSPTASLAVEHGLALARSLGITPTLLTVARDEDAGSRVLDRARAGVDDEVATEVVVDGDVRRGLVEAARGHDLLVLGNKGMSGPSRLLGSVANRVTHEIPTDLLLVNTTR